MIPCDFKNKLQLILNDIGGEWYVKKFTILNTQQKIHSRVRNNENKKKMKGKLRVAIDHWKDCKFQIHWKVVIFNVNQMQYKENPFCMSSNKLFVKYGLQDNHWVGHSVIKPDDSVWFQKIKSVREGDNEYSENFEMCILTEGVLDKEMTVPEKEHRVKTTLEDNISGYLEWILWTIWCLFPKEVTTESNKECNVSNFIPV